MTYINVGALVNGERPRFKIRLKEALDTAPDTVTFDGTSPLSPGGIRDYRPDEISEGVTLIVVGPDPETRRSWYANVTRSADGTLNIT
jgi:hypothetical protein